MGWGLGEGLGRRAGGHLHPSGCCAWEGGVSLSSGRCEGLLLFRTSLPVRMEARLLLGALLCAGLPPGELLTRVSMTRQSGLTAVNLVLLLCSLVSARCQREDSRW